MPIGVLPGSMTVDFGDVLMILDLVAITVLLVVVFIEEIATGSSRLLKLLNPSALLARFRLWRAAHKAPD